MNNRKVNVRKHKRRLKTGNATIVRKHKRQLRAITRIKKHNDPESKILPDAEWYRQNTGEDFYNYLYDNDDKKYHTFFLEQCFPLRNDPHLPNGMLCSLVGWSADDSPSNELILKRCGTDREGYISCVHTAITNISIEDLPKDLTELYGLSHGELMNMSPIEHFRALRSWAEGITEYGIENAILDSLADLDMPFGFNWELQRQFLNAIHDTYGDVGVLLAVDVLNNIYNNLDGDYDWSSQRFELLSHYVIGCGADIEMLEKCYQLFPDNIEYIKNRLAYGEDTSPEILERFFNEEKGKIVHLAENPSTPRDILEKLYNRGDYKHLGLILARNPSTPRDILEKLYKHGIYDIDYYLASNPSTPRDILEKFYNKHYFFINDPLASNPSTPIHILEALSHVEYASVRARIANNPSTPIHILEEFCFDKHYKVREYAERNILIKNYEKQKN